MLRIIRRVSGEKLKITVEEDLVPDVRALKHHVIQLHGLPSRFRQRLLLHGQCLEDTAALHPGMELDLVLLAFIPNPSPDEVQEFTAAAGAGHLDKVRAFNKVKFRKAHSEQIMRRGGFDVPKLKFPAVFPDVWTPMELTPTAIPR